MEGFKEYFRLAHKALKQTGTLRIRDIISRETVANIVSEEFQQCYLATESDPQEPTVLLPVTTIDLTNKVTSSMAQSTCSSASELTFQTLQRK